MTQPPNTGTEGQMTKGQLQENGSERQKTPDFSRSDEIVAQVNRTINETIERRCREWLETAKGTDWTATLERTIKDNATLEEKLAIAVEALENLHFPYSTDAGSRIAEEALAKIKGKE